MHYLSCAAADEETFAVTGRFIALEAPDGAGKTTIARHLADSTYDQIAPDLADAGPSDTRALIMVPRRQITATQPYAAGLMEHLSTMLWHSGDDPCLSDAFWVALQAAWGVAHTETVLQPLLDAGFDVLVDGWFYKLFAKLLVQGWDLPTIEATFARVRMPDAVVLITADLEAVYEHRKHSLRPAELGMHAGYTELNRDAFVRYQGDAQRHLVAFAERNGWHRVTRASADDVATTVAAVRAVVDPLRSQAISPNPLPR